MSDDLFTLYITVLYFCCSNLIGQTLLGLLFCLLKYSDIQETSVVQGFAKQCHRTKCQIHDEKYIFQASDIREGFLTCN